MSRFVDCQVVCLYAECHYTECHYAECRGASAGVFSQNDLNGNSALLSSIKSLLKAHSGHFFPNKQNNP